MIFTIEMDCKLFYYKSALQMTFTIKRHCKLFYYRSALQMIFTIKMDCQLFYYKKSLQMIFTIKRHCKLFYYKNSIKISLQSSGNKKKSLIPWMTTKTSWSWFFAEKDKSFEIMEKWK